MENANKKSKWSQKREVRPFTLLRIFPRCYLLPVLLSLPEMPSLCIQTDPVPAIVHWNSTLGQHRLLHHWGNRAQPSLLRLQSPTKHRRRNSSDRYDLSLVKHTCPQSSFRRHKWHWSMVITKQILQQSVKI